VLKIASAGAVRDIPAEAFAKGGNSDEHQDFFLISRFLWLSYLKLGGVFIVKDHKLYVIFLTNRVFFPLRI